MVIQLYFYLKILSFDKAIEFNPNYHQAFHNKGIALSNLN